jgi:hypothetical protein
MTEFQTFVKGIEYDISLLYQYPEITHKNLIKIY